MTAPHSKDMPKAYEPGRVEERLYKSWMERGYFAPAGGPGKKPFVIIMPPPNVTGELHLGHAVTATMEDIMVRWRRMLGDAVLWLPGTDHAGIATQYVVEAQLAKEGLTRQQLGRDAFVERVWQWVRQYGKRITEQHQRLGASCDWSREAFTLNDGPSRAVRVTFVNLYRKGLIYRGERMINWCPRCQTALSDLEVEHQDIQGNLWHMRYPMEEGGGSVTVATTRPETYLGDTAVAVHPDDPRYKRLIGTRVVLPIINRPIPIIADEAVGREFGTGAVKVTPHHDPTDFEIGQRHKLPLVNVMDKDGAMNEQAGPFKGMDRFAARKAVVQEFERLGLLEKTETHTHAVGHCQRCKAVVEPTVSLQWFVRIQPLAEPAIAAVKDGRIQIIPERFTKVYLNWMENIRDWCISRQLWWGHRIPVWYCADCGKETVETADPTACAHCGGAGLTQDPDVLDTWFSSALWPHSTLGWPDDTEDLRTFYPTTVMETGYDILFFWVARMIMMGIENTGEVPFRYVFLHGLVRDEHGEKMSKVRGNVINPIDAINEFGCDAIRFALSTGTAPGNDTRLSKQRMEAGRNFANKLWNASRFVIMALQQSKRATDIEHLPGNLHPEDRWILSRLHKLVQTVNRQMADFQFGEAERDIYEFLWSEYCDWYIERAKIRLRSPDERHPLPHPALAYALEKTLRLLHPDMPFITEEVWQSLKPHLANGPKLPASIMVAPYPTFDPQRDLVDEEAERRIAYGNAVVQGIRNARAEFKVDPNARASAVVSGAVDLLDGQLAAIGSLARADVSLDAGFAPTRDYRSYVHDLVQVHVHLPGLVDLGAERQKKEAELTEVEAAASRLEQRLNDQQFLGKAPAHVVEKERQRLASLKDKAANLRQRLEELGKG